MVATLYVPLYDAVNGDPGRVDAGISIMKLSIVPLFCGPSKSNTRTSSVLPYKERNMLETKPNWDLIDLALLACDAQIPVPLV